MIVRVLLPLAISLVSLPTIGQSCSLPSGVDTKQILPVVRSSDAVKRSFPALPRTVPQRQLNSELTVVFAENTKQAVSYFPIDAAERECWLDPRILELSLRNLSRVLPEVRVVEDKDGVFMVAAGGNYEASLILAPRLLRKVTGITDDLVIGIPNRDLLFIAALSNNAAVSALQAKVQRFYATGDHPLSEKLFVLNGNDLKILGGDAQPIIPPDPSRQAAPAR